MKHLRDLSEAATGGIWTAIPGDGTEVIVSSVRSTFFKDNPCVRDNDEDPRHGMVVGGTEWVFMSEEDKAFVVALVNAYRAGTVGERREFEDH